LSALIPWLTFTVKVVLKQLFKRHQYFLELTAWYFYA